jgi:hypothetical protein
MAFKEAFLIAEEVAKRTMSDFLWTHHQKKEPVSSGIIGLRSASIDFNQQIMPVLRLLCPSIRPVSCYMNNEDKPQYVLNWDEGSLVVPEFVIEESDKHFDDWMDMIGIGGDDEDSEKEEEEQFDPYSMVPLELF